MSWLLCHRFQWLCHPHCLPVQFLPIHLCHHCSHLFTKFCLHGSHWHLIGWQTFVINHMVRPTITVSVNVMSWRSVPHWIFRGVVLKVAQSLMMSELPVTTWQIGWVSRTTPSAAWSLSSKMLAWHIDYWGSNLFLSFHLHIWNSRLCWMHAWSPHTWGSSHRLPGYGCSTRSGQHAHWPVQQESKRYYGSLLTGGAVWPLIFATLFFSVIA